VIPRRFSAGGAKWVSPDRKVWVNRKYVGAPEGRHWESDMRYSRGAESRCVLGIWYLAFGIWFLAFGCWHFVRTSSVVDSNVRRQIPSSSQQEITNIEIPEQGRGRTRAEPRCNRSIPVLMFARIFSGVSRSDKKQEQAARPNTRRAALT